jgi:hypothetical protein
VPAEAQCLLARRPLIRIEQNYLFAIVDHPFPDGQIRHLAMWIKVTPYGNISWENVKILSNQISYLDDIL